MEVVYKIATTKKIINSLREKKQSVGLVPTMGALHKGHLSLLDKSVLENDYSIVTIFVNPTQFDKQEDLDNYPNTLKEDLEKLKNTGCDLVFVPNAQEMYQDNISADVFSFDGLEKEMEGKHRAGHFNGVGTIVKRFFEITQPTNAYFGEKDFQQLQIIKKMTAKENLPINIIGCPIYRERDGLAMSSRNMRLSPIHRKAGPFIYETLLAAKEKFASESIVSIHNFVSQAFEKHPLFEMEYFEIADETTLKTATEKKKDTNYRGFIAVYAENIRLIDNISLS